MANDPFRISEAGDLEVAVLHEAHELMADIITPFLYSVVGRPGDQQVSFKSAEAFQLFSIRVSELLSEARGNVAVEGAPSNLSVLSGLQWLSPRLSEPSASTLQGHVASLCAWLDHLDPCPFWCGLLEQQFELQIARRHLWNAWANSIKHTFLRLQKLTSQLQKWCEAAGTPVRDSDILYVLEAFEDWLSGYCVYHSTMMAQLIGNLFFALNRVIVERWEANNRTNDVGEMSHPPGASTFFMDLHGSVLAFQRYADDRITEYVPETSPNLRLTYLP